MKDMFRVFVIGGLVAAVVSLVASCGCGESVPKDKEVVIKEKWGE